MREVNRKYLALRAVRAFYIAALCALFWAPAFCADGYRDAADLQTLAQLGGAASASPEPPPPGEPAPAPLRSAEKPGWDNYIKRLAAQVKGDNLFDAATDRLQLLLDGAQTMPAVAADVERAARFVDIEIYQWEPNDIGARLRDLLARKVKSGVRVRAILDSCGSELIKPGSPEHKFLASMIADGIDARVRHFRLLHLDHRKVMVMDDGEGGLSAYTGGMNIGDDYQVKWHDQQTRVEGPAAQRLERSFVDAWRAVSGQNAELPQVPASVPGGARTYVVTHTGGCADVNIKAAYLEAIATARSSIRIEDPYFTDRDVIGALVAAARDSSRPGLKVQLIVPAKDDEQVTLHAFRSHYPEMLKAGIEIYEYQPRMEHMKVAVMDHFWATAGSSNLDPQSLDYNDELNLLVLDRGFASEMDSRVFDADIAQSARITSCSPGVADVIDGHLPFLAPHPGGV
jgi:cardiolipin synthase